MSDELPPEPFRWLTSFRTQFRTHGMKGGRELFSAAVVIGLNILLYYRESTSFLTLAGSVLGGLLLYAFLMADVWRGMARERWQRQDALEHWKRNGPARAKRRALNYVADQVILRFEATELAIRKHLAEIAELEPQITLKELPGIVPTVAPPQCDPIVWRQMANRYVDLVSEVHLTRAAVHPSFAMQLGIGIGQELNDFGPPPGQDAVNFNNEWPRVKRAIRAYAAGQMVIASRRDKIAAGHWLKQ